MVLRNTEEGNGEVDDAWDLAVSSQAPIFATSDVVPFRFTPNMQTFLGPIFTEGILTSGILAIARGLTEPEVTASQ